MTSTGVSTIDIYLVHKLLQVQICGAANNCLTPNPFVCYNLVTTITWRNTGDLYIILRGSKLGDSDGSLFNNELLKQDQTFRLFYKS